MKHKQLGFLICLLALFFVSNVFGATLEELEAMLSELAAENAQLRGRIEQLEKSHGSEKTAESYNSDQVTGSDYLKVAHNYSYEILDPTSNITRKQELILKNKQNGTLSSDAVYLSGAVTAIADYQESNTESKFGYLMRHPTKNNQRTKTVSEAVVHSSQLALTANIGDWITAYSEMLYDPQQSFGSGTTTDLNRNQVQLRQGYVLFGNLNKSPLFLSIGKMAIPFGLTDTPNPFTASTVWHAFGGLAYGLNVGYNSEALSIRVMGVQGGAQFRAANVPVDDSNVPSRLNNIAVDLSYTIGLTSETKFSIGSSYLRGSAYCQDFPVQHFSACEEENGAYDIYTQLKGANWSLQAEYAKTLEEWPGTFNPNIPQHEASKVTSWDIGGKYNAMFYDVAIDFSLDFSRFIAGPSGADWEKQDQWVLGVAGFITPSAKIFGEVIRTEGYAPLNFISGGNLDPGVTHSDRDASSNILMIGTNIAF